MSLAERLRERISREGPISFRDFMAAALYDPEEGYYSLGAPIGEPGDFATSPSISPAFAAVLARRFARDVSGLEGPVDFVEVGAGGGQFLEDFAAALARQSPETAARVRLTAIECSRGARRLLALRGIRPTPHVLASVEELTPGRVAGWIFSNELYDALPVVRVTGGQYGLEELRVAAEGESFVWSRAPAREEWREHLESFGVTLAPGQTGEIALDAAPLHGALARALRRGWIVAFDYGHRAPVLYHPLARKNGTLAVHSGGRRMAADPLSDPGRVDLTAHVNWDALIRAGERAALITWGLIRQGRFLCELGLFDLVDSSASSAQKWRAYRLIDPEGMGEELSVLVQSKGV